MDDHLESVIAFYERAGDEGARLSASALGQLEFARSKELLLRFLPPGPATVLDVGGGSGAYAAWLSELGYSVVVVEPVPVLRQAAEARADASSRPFQVVDGNAGSLPVPTGSHDAVLLFGPMYHLPDLNDRQRAWSETRRVLKAGGMAAVVSINRYAGLLDSLRHEFVDTGFGRVGYFHADGELEHEARQAGFVVDGVFGIEGPGSLVTDLDERWADPAQREAILQAARTVEQEPSLRGASHHLLLIGRPSV